MRLAALWRGAGRAHTLTAMLTYDGIQKAGRFPTRSELPYYSWSDWDSVGKVKAALRRLETGYLDQPALMVDAMMRDDRIAGCLSTLTDAIPSLPRTWDDGETSSSTDTARSDLDELMPRMVPDEDAAQLLRWGKMLGIGIAENVWERDADSGLIVPRLKVWHPRFLYWNWGSRSFWLITREGSIEIEPGNGQWVLYTPRGYRRAWMEGAVRFLHVQWLLRQWALRDSGRYSEVYGTPLRKAKVPHTAKDEEKSEFFNAVASLGAESTIRLPAGADGTPFDVELMEATGNGFEGFMRLIDSASVSIAVGLLGQNLTTEVKGGSFAAARVHGSIRADILQSESGRFANCINEQVLKPFARLNYGDEKAAPRLMINAEPPEDTAQVATTWKTAGEAIASLRTSGLPVDGKKAAERLGLPVVEELMEDVLEPQEAEPAPGEEPEEDEDEDEEEPAPPKKKQAASSNAAAIEGQLRIEALVRDAATRGTLASAMELAKLHHAVTGASDFGELEARIIAAFGQLDAKQMTKLLQQAFMLAELEGRFAASQEG